ncbi:phosphoenolpyruvate synthase [Parafilimonas terrae]|uniref:Phosphoenolpyruvate synthase n=1 Tax=Parafilimonas terrae TaxID=1465490 RepID=A0A1I5TC81_9BACT|nr:phosphoenolpyruvate synthase [Parafilimonas terrae]SFP80664.1 phosphoenolpyruvate synthase [Parafilimonas terrae]
MEPYIKKFNETGIDDVASVGGKNASLGEMYNKLSSKGIRVPDGFATTSYAFKKFLEANGITGALQQVLSSLDKKNYSNLDEISAKARALMANAKMPDEIATEIIQHYHELCKNKPVEVAVRSSATAEDLPHASFAGQHESYLNIKGDNAVVEAVHKCFTSLYTARAIKYREDNGFEHDKVLLSAGVQKMVRSDKACSGVGFTLEPESGFRDVIHLAGVWGLGENIVQGAVTPDEFYIFKPTLRQGKNAIIQKKTGSKLQTMVYARKKSNASTINISTPLKKRTQYVLNNDEIIQLANWALLIEDHYQKQMDIEWAKDGLTNELFIIQARPETVHSQKNTTFIEEYKLKEKGTVLTSGNAIGEKVAAGIARILLSPNDASKLKQGEIIVTDITSPDWDPILKKVSAIITNKGGRTSHASIVAREQGVPAVVGCTNATAAIKDGQTVTVSCCEGSTGYVYEDKLNFEKKEIDVSKLKKPDSTEVMLILADPDKAFQLSFYPNDGVGLLRLEFIITHFIQAHPMALVNFDLVKDRSAKQKIKKLTQGYSDKKEFFVDRLSQGIATIAAAFYPKDVIVRMSDFKTNEYANLIGGKQFEPEEENPMLGFRGASRYYSDLYKDGFKLECAAIKKVRGEMGLNNVKIMIPFCRTIEEGKKVIEVMTEFGLNKNEDESLEIYVMAEIPSNVLLAEQFAELFDGFSIGSNDLTQLTLGVDRDSTLVSGIFSEQNEAARKMINTVIKKANACGTHIGLCGQAPSDFPEFAQFLVEEGINSISFNADALLKGIENINKAEKLLRLPA